MTDSPIVKVDPVDAARCQCGAVVNPEQPASAHEVLERMKGGHSPRCSRPDWLEPGELADYAIEDGCIDVAGMTGEDDEF